MSDSVIVFNAGRLDRSVFIDRDSYVKAARAAIVPIAAGQ